MIAEAPSAKRRAGAAMKRMKKLLFGQKKHSKYNIFKLQKQENTGDLQLPALTKSRSVPDRDEKG